MKQLKDLTKNQFDGLKECGMLWELYPEAPENYEEISPSQGFNEENTMVYINGSMKSERCDCGCNVFKKSKDGVRFKCNGCETIYRSE